MTGRTAFLVIAVLAICSLVAEPTMASPYAGSRPAGMPQWVPISIDHPTPTSSPLPVVLMAGSAVRDIGNFAS